MTQTELHNQYQTYFDSIFPVIDYLKQNWHKHREYLGWKDLNSPLILNPIILFIGINPGPGRYRSWNNGKGWAKHVLPPDFPTPWRSSIGWLTVNNARVYKNGEEAQWWDIKAKQHNLLPYTMCKLLCELFPSQVSSMEKVELTDFFNQHIMVTNVSPLVTNDLASLNKLYAKLREESSWNEPEKIFVNHTLRMIDLVKPQMIVYLGKSEKNLIHNEIKKRNIPTVTINRKRGWHGKENIKAIASQIREKIK